MRLPEHRIVQWRFVERQWACSDHRQPEQLGVFKIGALRNVALTAPCMHNGMFKTLREVIDYYDDPDRFVPDAINRDSLLARPLRLSEQDKVDLEAFLQRLTSRSLAGK